MPFPIRSSFGGRLAPGLAVTLFAVLTTGVTDRATAAGVGWGYSGNIGPGHWGEDFALCGTGKNQSPINIADPHILA